jgi:ubiquinone biosynthesis protein COQ4
MKILFNNIRGLMGFVRLVRKPDLNDVFRISDSLARDPKQLVRMTQALMADKSTRKALEARPRLGAVDLPSLRDYPRGTLGRSFADFLSQNALSLEDLPHFSADSPEEYVVAHLYETHDLWHCLTGFDTSVEGEIGLQAFYLAQLPGRLAAALIAAALLNGALYSPDELRPRMESIVRGWTLGKGAKPVFGIDWSRHWSRPLADVRFELGIEVQQKSPALRPQRRIRDGLSLGVQVS